MTDIYDLFFLIEVRKLHIERTHVMEKMQKRNERFDIETLLKKLDATTNSTKWKSELAYLVNPLPDYNEVIKKIKMELSLP